MNLSAIFKMVLTSSFMGIVLVGIIIIVKYLFKNKFSARWHYCIWLLLIIKLAIPYGPENTLSIFNLFVPFSQGIEISQNIEVDAKEKTPLQETNNNVYNTSNNSTSSLQNKFIKNSNSPVSAYKVFSLIWLITAVVMASYILSINIKFIFNMKNQPKCSDEEILHILEECKSIVGIKSNVQIIYNKSIKTPSLLGLINPRLLVSPHIFNELSYDEIKYVFLHELTHLKRKDIFFNLIMLILQSIHWFNPIIWYAFYKTKEDCEISCDAEVLSYLKPTEYKKYGESIIRLLHMISNPYKFTCATGMANNKSCIKRRIGMIVNFKKSSIKWSLIAVVIVALLGFVGLTNAVSVSNPEDVAKGFLKELYTITKEDHEFYNKMNRGYKDGTKLMADLKKAGKPFKNYLKEECYNDFMASRLVILRMKDAVKNNYYQNVEKIELVKNEQNEDYIITFDYNISLLIEPLDGDKQISAIKDKLVLEKVNNVWKVQRFIYNEKNYYTPIWGIFKDKTPQTSKEALDNILYYMDKLKDKNFVKTYGDGENIKTWYTAAEELGNIGKPAIPYLIMRLSTKDDYERTLAFYALRLASQHENVKSFAKDFIDVQLDFEVKNHEKMNKTAHEWYRKYKSNFE